MCVYQKQKCRIINRETRREQPKKMNYNVKHQFGLCADAGRMERAKGWLQVQLRITSNTNSVWHAELIHYINGINCSFYFLQFLLFRRMRIKAEKGKWNKCECIQLCVIGLKAVSFCWVRSRTLVNSMKMNLFLPFQFFLIMSDWSVCLSCVVRSIQRQFVKQLTLINVKRSINIQGECTIIIHCNWYIHQHCSHSVAHSLVVFFFRFSNAKLRRWVATSKLLVSKHYL